MFFAIEFDPAIRAALAAVREHSPMVGRGIRWADDDHLHLTLRFLGEISPQQEKAVTAAARAASSSVEPFELQLKGLGCFPDQRQPKVLWAGVTAEPRLMTLAAGIEQGVVESGLPADRRRFRPHVTLARLKERGRWNSLGVEPVFGRQRVTSFALFASVLTRRGSIYEKRARFALGNQADEKPR